jgi:Spy/CpxP family protein refolding chaperone
LERQVWARFGEIVRERLGLTAEGQRELGEVLRTYQEDREALALREAQLQRRVLSEGLLTAPDVAPLLTDEEAREILSEMEAIRDEERRLAAAEQERLLEILTPSQLVRFHALRDALNQRTRGLRQGGPARQGGAGRGGGPLGLPPG